MANFFSLYNDYTSKTTESPHVFHAWSAIGAISALLGKKCLIYQGHFTVYPHMYIVLVGSAGSKKTTAMDIARKIVESVGTVPMAPDSATRESLIDEMSRSQVSAELHGKNISFWQSSAFLSELEQFLGGRHINQAMIGFLTAIWDRDIFKERTRKGGEVVINNPYFTMLGCCTTSWMNEKLKQDVISDGFTRRTCFVLGGKAERKISWPVFSAASVETKAKLYEEAKRINSIKGVFGITAEALEVYDSIYRGLESEAENFSEKLATYWTSKHILILKTCMCIAAGARHDLIIDTQVLETALAFLESSERHMEEIFAGVGRNELKSQAEKIFKRIEARGSVSRRELMLLSYEDVNRIEFDEIMEYLVTTRRVTSRVAEDQVFEVSKAAGHSPALRLLELAGQIGPCRERKLVDYEAFDLSSRLAPETVQLLTRQEERQAEIRNGLLLRGKLAQGPDGSR